MAEDASAQGGRIKTAAMAEREEEGKKAGEKEAYQNL